MPSVDLTPYYQPQGSTSDGTKFDNLLSLLQSTLNGLDHNNLSGSAGILASQLADPTTGKVLGSSGGACAAVFPPGYEFAYNEFTAPVSITATTEGTANTVVTASAVTFDGSTVALIEFFCPSFTNPAGASVTLVLYQDGASIGQFAVDFASASVQIQGPIRVARRLTPASGSRTYSIRAFVGSGTGTISAGAGGSGASVPGFIRVVKAA